MDATIYTVEEMKTADELVCRYCSEKPNGELCGFCSPQEKSEVTAETYSNLRKTCEACKADASSLKLCAKHKKEVLEDLMPDYQEDWYWE